jgi:hypothetical protein
MRVTLQLVMCSDAGQAETVTDVLTLDQDNRRLAPRGLPLAEAQQLLRPCSTPCRSTQSLPFATPVPPARPGVPGARGTPPRAARSAPGWAPVACPARGGSMATARHARRRHAAPGPRGCPRRSPLRCGREQPPGPPWSPRAGAGRRARTFSRWRPRGMSRPCVMRRARWPSAWQRSGVTHPPRAQATGAWTGDTGAMGSTNRLTAR